MRFFKESPLAAVKQDNKDLKNGQETKPLAKRGIFDPSIIEHRERLAAAKPLGTPADVPHIDTVVPLASNVKMPARIYFPKAQSEKATPLPTLFYIPGTAFIANEVQFTRVICSHICKIANCRVVVIQHRLAPENQFPNGLNDAYDMFKFFLENKTLLVDRERVAIAGYSSGGNFAAQMALWAKRDKLPISKQILISPMVDLSRSCTEYKEFENKDGTISEQFVNFFLNLYLPEDVNPQDPTISPLYHKASELRGLPPTDIIQADYDRFRSDAEAYYKKLQEAQVLVQQETVDNADHSYLWYKLEVVESIAKRLIMCFAPLRMYIEPKQHYLLHIRPMFNSKQLRHDDIVETTKTKSEMELARAKL